MDTPSSHNSNNSSCDCGRCCGRDRFEGFYSDESPTVSELRAELAQERATVAALEARQQGYRNELEALRRRSLEQEVDALRSRRVAEKAAALAAAQREEAKVAALEAAQQRYRQELGKLHTE